MATGAWLLMGIGCALVIITVLAVCPSFPPDVGVSR